MKRESRKWLEGWAHDPFNGYWSEEAQDVLDSDTRLRAEIRDLKARLRCIANDNDTVGAPMLVRMALDLKNKKWKGDK